MREEPEVQADAAVARALTAARVIMDAGPAGLAKDEIREQVEHYRAARLHGQSRESWDREFSRDKKHLRGIGIDLTETSDHRYVIEPKSYGLQPLKLDLKERLELQRMAHLLSFGQVPGLDHALWALGADTETAGAGSWRPRVQSALMGTETEVENLLALSELGLYEAVRFDYTSFGSSHSEQREVISLGLGLRGRWYLVAYDLQRNAQRTFRLDRLGTLPVRLKDAGRRKQAVLALEALDVGQIDIAAVLDSIPAAQKDVAGFELIYHLHAQEPEKLPRLRSPSSAPVIRRAQSKAERVLNLASYLLSAGGVRPSELMSRYSISSYQLHRDLLTLQQVGTFDRNLFGGYIDVSPLPPLTRSEFQQQYLADDEPITLYDPQLDGNAPLTRPISLTKPGALALLLGIKTLQNSDADQPTEPAVEAARKSLRKKLLAVVPGELAESAESFVIAHGISTDSGTKTLKEALENEHAVEIDYEDADGVRTTRVVEPVQLLRAGESTYVRAWCRLATDIRHFALGRMKRATAVKDSAIGSEAKAATAANGDVLKVPRSEQSVTVTLAFAPFARSQQEFFNVERIRAVGDRIVIQTHYRSVEAIIRRVLDSAGGIELLSPPDIREQIRARADQARRGTGPQPRKSGAVGDHSSDEQRSQVH